MYFLLWLVQQLLVAVDKVLLLSRPCPTMVWNIARMLHIVAPNSELNNLRMVKKWISKVDLKITDLVLLTIIRSPKIWEIFVTIVNELPKSSSGISSMTISRLKSGVSSVTPGGRTRKRNSVRKCFGHRKKKLNKMNCMQCTHWILPGVARVTRTTGTPPSSSLSSFNNIIHKELIRIFVRNLLVKKKALNWSLWKSMCFSVQNIANIFSRISLTFKSTVFSNWQFFFYQSQELQRHLTHHFRTE